MHAFYLLFCYFYYNNQNMKEYGHKKYIHITCDMAFVLHALSRPRVLTSWAV